ncbi:Class I SAM-dependent rRNA methyltransferase [Sulfidibacter corallicola]|uniref:Class I SAM-dependent rRNA methyltransferase n=1 Tax=Sulfidibacter corallicola TaxID=2818388 RepID=A0A8A4TW96_SULCO|nr:class I SAM-dependent rRNA methyltransferase [Sulfidibacter corallicola]QTD53404.1 class I SAM-dependent rRNA methyltransferase [Sulfidibacter corallicola]
MSSSAHATAVLHGKRAEILRRYGHPWIYSKGVTKKPEVESGELVRVASAAGDTIGWAFFHPRNNICLRLVHFGQEAPDEAFWRDRLARAWRLRQRFLPPDTNAFRWIHGENDGLPGLTVDVFDQVLVMQITTQGFERLREPLSRWLCEVSGRAALFEKSDTAARGQEGLQPRTGWVTEAVAEAVTLREGGIERRIDLASGHKTGFYLDQRDQRAWLRQVARDASVLDLFSYTGGFSISALAGDAGEVLAVDSSSSALAEIPTQAELNGLDTGRLTTRRADIFAALRDHDGPLAPRPNGFDIVVCDPPAMAKSHRANDQALKGYRKLNRDACLQVADGGLFLTFSCSGVVSEDDFRQSVFLGLRDSRREGLVLKQFGPGFDHPTALHFPEGRYLKGLALQIRHLHRA